MNSEFVEIPSLSPTPDIFSCKRVLAIQAHYDDIDIAVGGLVAQLVKNGAEVLYVTVTDDLAGVIDLTLSKEVAAARLAVRTTAGGRHALRRRPWRSRPAAAARQCRRPTPMAKKCFLATTPSLCHTRRRLFNAGP